MLRCRLHNKFLKTKTEESKQQYDKKRNHCLIFLRKIKENHFAETDKRHCTQKNFPWRISSVNVKTVSLLFSKKTYQKESIMITNKVTDETITKNKELVTTLNFFFQYYGWNFQNRYDIDKLTKILIYSDPVVRTIETIKNHPSTSKIKTLTQILR